ncbi:uncharacterized protein LOC144437844 [Glandiceps talaboti]
MVVHISSFVLVIACVTLVTADEINVFLDTKVIHQPTGLEFGPFYIRKQSAEYKDVNAPKQEFKNCGTKAMDFTLDWTPKGPLKIGHKYNLTFDTTAVHDMRDGTADPIVYFNDYLLFNSKVRFCKLIPEKYHVCPLKKGDKLHFETEVTLQGDYVEAGRYHGNATLTNEKGEDMMCILGDVTLT